MKFGMEKGIGHKSYLRIECGILLNNYTCGGVVKLEVYLANVSVQNLYWGKHFFLTANWWWW
jgi:hypothetical protein